MFDFSITEISKGGSLYCSLFYLIVIGIYWKRAVVKRVPIDNHTESPLLLFMVSFFYVTAVYTGDFFSYMAHVEEYYPGIPRFHLEKVYEYIIEFTNKNYLLFRIVVWGSASILYYMTARCFHVNTMLSLFITFLLFPTIFCYARATLAMAVYFLGFAYFCKGKEQQSKISVLYGIALIFLSFVFHRSALVMIMLTAVYFIQITKKNFVFILIAVMILGISIDIFMTSLLTSLQDVGDSKLEERASEILAADLGSEEVVDKRTFLGQLLTIWEYVPFYLSFFIVSKIMLYNKSLIKSKTIMALFRITFSLVVLANAILLFSSGSLTNFYRILYMSFIPLSILVVYLYTNNYMSKSNYKSIVYIGGGWNIYMFFSMFLKGIGV